MQAAHQVSLKKQLQQLQSELYHLDIEVQRAIYDPSLTPEEFAPLNRRITRKRAELKAVLHQAMGLRTG